MLRDAYELSIFPGSFGVVRWLEPQRVSLRWTSLCDVPALGGATPANVDASGTRDPAQPAGLAYEGLVWCDDHWAWFRKTIPCACGGAG